MVISNNTNWRQTYYQQVMTCLKEFCGKPAEIPATLTLPASDKNCMFEFGGSKYSSGTAMLVATPSGFPNSAIALKQRKRNGIHASSKIWINCLIGIAHHQYGITNIGIYQVKRIRKADSIVQGTKLENVVDLELIVGLTQASPEQTRDLDWLSPYHRKYPGLRKLATVLLDKLEMFNCAIPMYLEPFRIIRKYTQKEPDFNKLMLYTDLTVPENLSELVPKYVIYEKNMAEVIRFDHFYQFENALTTTCQQLVQTYPFIYLLLCHHTSPGESGGVELLTHAFICSQENEGKPLLFHKTGYVYKHTGQEIGRSTDLEGFIRSNYNESYLHSLLGVHGGGIQRLLTYIKSSKDGCLYVPLKFVLCTRKYTQF